MQIAINSKFSNFFMKLFLFKTYGEKFMCKKILDKQKANNLLNQFEQINTLKKNMDNYTSIKKEDLGDLIPDELNNINKAILVAKTLKKNS